MCEEIKEEQQQPQLPEVVKNYSQLLEPIQTPDDAKLKWQMYQELKNKLATSDDFVSIQGSRRPCKAWAQKMGVFFNISSEIVYLEKVQGGRAIIMTKNEDGTRIVTTLDAPENEVSVTAIVRATTASGRFKEDIGTCEVSEKQKGRMAATAHNVIAHGITRANSRAVLGIVAPMENVSAEELQAPPEATEIEYKQPKTTVTEKKAETITDDQIGEIEYLLSEKDTTLEVACKELSEKHGRNIKPDLASFNSRQAEWLIEKLKTS